HFDTKAIECRQVRNQYGEVRDPELDVGAQLLNRIRRSRPQLVFLVAPDAWTKSAGSSGNSTVCSLQMVIVRGSRPLESLRQKRPCRIVDISAVRADYGSRNQTSDRTPCGVR